MMNSKISFIH